MKRIFQARALLHRFNTPKLLRKTCGHGVPDAKGPFDATTRTEDLRGLMDSLGIAKAHLAGWSLAGNDITAMACTHPERVDSIVYLEGVFWDEVRYNFGTTEGEKEWVSGSQATPNDFIVGIQVL